MEIKVPAVGESVTEALIGRWIRHDGERVAKNDPVCEIETDKITFEVAAEADGVLSVKVPEGETVPIGAVIAVIEEGSPAVQQAPPPMPAAEGEQDSAPPPLSPAARKLVKEKGIHPGDIRGSGRGGRITVEDLLVEQKEAEAEKQHEVPAEAERTSGYEASTPSSSSGAERETRRKMTPIRKRIAEHLLAARQQTAMLTTFNEADMSRVVALRKRHKEDFRRKHGVSLGFLPFFIKACAEALRDFPALNGRIDGEEIVYHNFYDIGIAVSGEKGLVVPVLRNVDRLSFAQMEQGIAAFVERIANNQLTLAELEGGTFTITNGGVYGSLLSTPILNPPQSGVLGLHAVQERPVAREGRIEIRPMMYLALSYDHRIVDGREAVQFLKKVKELVEEPEEMLIE
ncbi:2-oxoglutarate dehydrogenase complex dihydrolipoyllysine-residue succinyltransferase [Geobacter sp. DSM 9736]|uniref:2-oxoglutarate dehydrogenase complex dihydrolipoyllysine-residue succinyltransferase n=1 Tax=Geobacter sp. DSM 9736 TaxID=1277350 RepID=UPI000B512A7D|nr:2-oxoglutarate dehydrogenase E2 component [Geobacter sp. DSM 9736]